MPSDGTDYQSLPNAVVALLPTPAARDSHNAGDPDRTAARMADRGQPLTEVAVNVLMPTPRATDGTKGGPNTPDDANLWIIAQRGQWGEYEPAIRRWEALTRPAPEPTKLNAKGNPKLSDEFDEWLMGYPAGWITDVPGVTWNETLKACGNGVVPQQGAAGLRWLLAMGGAA